jgi:hypothetical protein
MARNNGAIEIDEGVLPDTTAEHGIVYIEIFDPNNAYR